MTNRAHLILRTDRPADERPFILRPPEPGEKERAEAKGRLLAGRVEAERQQANAERLKLRRRCPKCHRQRSENMFSKSTDWCIACIEYLSQPRQRCITCNVTKPLTSYYRAPEHANGLAKECKACHSRRASANKRRQKEAKL